jgi:hypothetical protein
MADQSQHEERLGEDDRAAREAATRELSVLLKRLQTQSGVTWDQLASTVAVNRKTIANYLGAEVRQRDRKILLSLLDAMNASEHERNEALRLHRASLPKRSFGNRPGDSTQHPAKSPVLTIGAIPELVGGFQVRDEVARLREATCPGTATVLTEGVGQAVLSGLGGVGKTQLAANWARQLRDSEQVDLLVWARAATSVDIASAYAEAALMLDLPGTANGSRRDLFEDARRFLTSLVNNQLRWAIVLDNLDDPLAISGLWPPTTLAGGTVITTRRRDASLLAGRAVVDVDVFTPPAAIAFLKERLPVDLVENEDAVKGVVKDLGRLPLALSHAAAYMIDRNLSCRHYRQRFADRRRKLADLFPDTQTLFDGSRATVASTWSLSIDAADALTPRGLASQVLRMASVLDSAAIPVALFTTPAALGYLGASDSEVALDALANLRRFGLITRSDGDINPLPALDSNNNKLSTIGVHSLVQRAVRDSSGFASMDGAAHSSATALMQLWPPGERDNTILLAVLRAKRNRSPRDQRQSPMGRGHWWIAGAVPGNL